MTDPARALAASRMYLMEEDVGAIEQAVRLGRRDEPVMVLDLGSGSGTSALAVLGVAPNARILSIDIDADASGWARKNVVAHYPEADVTYVVGPVRQLGEHPSGFWPRFDVVLHDAGHAYEDVYWDLREWLPKFATAGCPVWIHDAVPPPESWGQKDESAGVQQAIVDLQQIEVLGDGSVVGLGWLGRAGHAMTI